MDLLSCQTTTSDPHKTTLIMPGLDPGILASQAKKGLRVRPGDDEITETY
jgi:hypothetical protein